MPDLVLQDFGGQFLTSEKCNHGSGHVPGISAYVEWFIPKHPRNTSVTFVHGGGGQGAEFLRTSDGRPGWAHAFLAAGFPVFVLDRPGHGRCTWNDDVLGPAISPPTYETLYPYFVEPARKIMWPEAEKHRQWPDSESAGDRFMASQGRMATSLEAAQRHVEEIAPSLFDLTGRTAIISHSAGGPCGWAMSAIGGERVAAIVAVEPLGFPGQEHSLGHFSNGLVGATFAGEYDPYGCPIAVVTGEATWMRKSNAEAVAFLERSGKNVEHIRLWEHGICGNGHMMMSESNSDEIAQLLVRWLEHAIYDGNSV
jgi:pimeloyl-ACP methyl ester carboxylesterase